MIIEYRQKVKDLFEVSLPAPSISFLKLIPHSFLESKLIEIRGESELIRVPRGKK